MNLCSVAQILEKSPKISDWLKNSETYYAHTSSTLRSESLEEHFDLVGQYFATIVSKQNLNSVIDNLISEFLKDHHNNECVIEVGDFLKTVFCNAILFHDYGKINENFQADKFKMNNPHFGKVNNDLETRHSELGAYLFIVYSFSELSKKTWAKGEIQAVISFFILFHGYCIQKHHGSSLLNPSDELPFKSSITLMSEYAAKLWAEIPVLLKVTIPEGISRLIALYDKVKISYEFPLFALVKLNYSLLTASDYLATTHYMSQWSEIPTDLGLLGKEQKQRMVLSIKSSKPYNKVVYDNFDGFVFKDPQEQSNGNLNQLRNEMAVEVIQNIRKNIDKHLFYIEAPTGGGKTNLSMIALAELLAADLDSGKDSINKVFYVFPFTTLITQTHKVLQDTFDLQDGELTQIHSKAGLQDKNKSDDTYGDQRLNYIDYLFVNYPLVLLSHIKFFDILKTNRKESNYLLHRLANSVVIIDELQSYSPSQWDKMMYLIDNYAKLFNIRFILMSATLPKIGKLLGANKESEFTYLINDKNKYFLNANFKCRVAFDFSLFNSKTIKKEDKPQYLCDLAKMVFSKSKEYRNQNSRVFTIIEFIFKKTATDFYHLAEELNLDGFFDEIFVLSGTILESRRNEIIVFLKSLKNASKNILLVTTQVVEAGVDIDMDLGFKDTSMVDSDEQLAGRINRNVNKKQCKLYLFNCDSAKVLYKKDLRYNLLTNELADQYHSILENKNFDLLYDAVIDQKNNRNSSDYFEGLNDYKEAVRKMNFSLVDSAFKLIDQDNYSIFIPLEIPIGNPASESENNFSKSELTFLAENQKYNLGDSFVKGANVWALYEEFVLSSRSKDFLLQKYNMTNLQGIMSKFIISIFAQSKDIVELRSRACGEEKYGFLYLTFWEKDGVYNYHSGLNISDHEALIF